MNQSTVASFILGFLTSVLLALAFVAGQQHSPERSVSLENQQILLDSKLHLIEMKVDVLTERKDVTELQTDYEQVMDILEQSHQYTGEGIIARDRAMREAAARINEALLAGGENLLESIESLLEAIERHLHPHEESETEGVVSESDSVE